MYNEKLNGRIYAKIEDALHIYEKYVYTKVGELENAEALQTKEHLRSVPAEGWEPLAPRYSWGGEWVNLWIRGTYTVPEALAGKKLYVMSHPGCGEQLYFLNGVPKGLFNTKNRDYIGGDHASQYIGALKAGQTVSLAFECYAGHFIVGCAPYDNYDYPDMPAPSFTYTYEGVDICTRDEDIFTLIFDLRELCSAAKDIPEHSFLPARARKALQKVSEVLVFYPKHASDEAFRKGVKDALAITRPFFSGGNSRIFGKAGIIGHSHMDTAWLWPVSETIRKCARTYANALHLMEQYPDYNFIQSSALHSEWMKDYYPDIFEDMKKRVREGRYEPNGGVYVECDCNITSGELMVRQFLKGQQFTRENFDYTADSFWLPDTFGYNGNIPQIMRGSEVKYFYTTKISWNEQNKFPFESFTWRGIDGSEVLTHFNRTHCWPDIADIAENIDLISMKDTTDMRLVSYGYGDGGGGPTPGMIESAHRAMATEGMPIVEPMTVSAFMKELETQQADLPVYNDELYLELHRGTLTQMHDVKRKNRKAEFALRDMEYFHVLAGREITDEQNKRLKTLLKNQFHDILPGTCITPVYDTYNKEMDALLAEYAADTSEDIASLVAPSKNYTAFNTLSFDRSDAVVIENAEGFAADYPSQKYTDLCGRELLSVGGVKIPGFGSEIIEIAAEAKKAESPFVYDGKKLETPFAVIEFDDDGYIASYFDKTSRRELRKEGGEPLNVLLFGEDVPLAWDNWDVEKSIVDNLKPVKGFKGREIVTDGAVELRLRSRYEIGDGTALSQDMVFYADSPRIDFHTLVDWNSPHRLLKAGFDLDISSTFARNEIQYGHVKRPTTANNSLEVAKFEVCNYKWTDLSEPGFGAAILNDCKYGITVLDCNLRLSLHRGGSHPDVTGDSGVHELTYSLLVHDGDFGAKTVVKPAYELNVPVVAAKGEAKIDPIVYISAKNIIVESVKPAEDGSGRTVIRLYECEGRKTTTAVDFGRDATGAVLTNFLEDEKEALELNELENCAQLVFRPFEIKTIKF